LTWTVEHAVQRCTSAHSPSSRVDTPIGSIDPEQSASRSPGTSSSTWRLHRQFGQWLRCCVPGADIGTSSRQRRQRKLSGPRWRPGARRWVVRSWRDKQRPPMRMRAGTGAAARPPDLVARGVMSHGGNRHKSLTCPSDLGGRITSDVARIRLNGGEDKRRLGHGPTRGYGARHGHRGREDPVTALTCAV
jgi:hypothetical protein